MSKPVSDLERLLLNDTTSTITQCGGNRNEHVDLPPPPVQPHGGGGRLLRQKAEAKLREAIVSATFATDRADDDDDPLDTPWYKSPDLS